ncbi:hypothetical protein [Sessilibacter sp. MAH4]
MFEIDRRRRYWNTCVKSAALYPTIANTWYLWNANLAAMKLFSVIETSVSSDQCQQMILKSDSIGNSD